MYTSWIISHLNLHLSSQSKTESHFNLFSICSEVNSTCYSPPKLANQNAQKALLTCEYVLMKVIFGWLMKISFSCILASTCVTSPPPLAVYHLVRNVHTGWMTSHYTENTANTPGYHLASCKHRRYPLLFCCCVHGMVPAVLFLERNRLQWVEAVHIVYTHLFLVI